MYFIPIILTLTYLYANLESKTIQTITSTHLENNIWSEERHSDTKYSFFYFGLIPLCSIWSVYFMWRNSDILFGGLYVINGIVWFLKIVLEKKL